MSQSNTLFAKNDSGFICAGCGREVPPLADSRRGFVITHRCTVCGFTRNNRSQSDDDTELLIKFTNPYNIE